MIFIDQIGQHLKLDSTPKRIISLVPSQTELLYDLGLENEVVGITKFCIHPKDWFNTKTRIGGTKTLDIKKIKSLHPDLIIANKEENTKAQIEELQMFFPVYTSNISNLLESLAMIQVIGTMTNTIEKANELIRKIEFDFNRLSKLNFKSKTALYLIWKNPFMAVGTLTFINDIMKRAGFINVINSNDNYPVIDESEWATLNPEIVLLSSEPYPFKEKHLFELQISCPNSQILLVDGEMFSWYGSRLTKTVDYLFDLYRKID